MLVSVCNLGQPIYSLFLCAEDDHVTTAVMSLSDRTSILNTSTDNSPSNLDDRVMTADDCRLCIWLYAELSYVCTKTLLQKDLLQRVLYFLSVCYYHEHRLLAQM